MSKRSTQLADEAARRGWRNSATGEGLRLHDRWKWPVRFEHPFRYGSRGTGPTRRDRTLDVISGSTRAGQTFLAFWTPHLASAAATGQGGLPNMPTRCVACVTTGTSLPTVTVVSRGGLARPYMAKLAQWAARRAQRYADSGEMVQRLNGWDVGSEELRRHYKIEADERQQAEWLLGPDTRERLLADPSVSLCSIGTDILAWCDRGYGGDGFDITTVEALLDVLDTVELRQ